MQIFFNEYLNESYITAKNDNLVKVIVFFYLQGGQRMVRMVEGLRKMRIECSAGKMQMNPSSIIFKLSLSSPQEAMKNTLDFTLQLQTTI